MTKPNSLERTKIFFEYDEHLPEIRSRIKRYNNKLAKKRKS